MSAKNNRMPTTKKGRDAETLAKASAAVRAANKIAYQAKKVLAAQSGALTKEQIEEIVSKTVLSTLATIGIRAHTDEDVDELRKDFAYTRAWRKTVQSTTRTGWLTFVTVFATGFAAVLFIAARLFLTGHP